MTDVWQYLRGIDRPIVMYGTGNGADRIFSVFDRLGITVSAIFASDGFVRSRTFHGIPVVSYADVLKKYGGNFIIVLAFGSDRQEVLERFYQLDDRHELYAPDVPAFSFTHLHLPSNRGIEICEFGGSWTQKKKKTTDTEHMT